MKKIEQHLYDLQTSTARSIRSSLPSGHIIGNSAGVTLFEILVALVILAVAIVPMLGAFAPGLSLLADQEETVVFTNQARGTLNKAAALDFATLSNSLGDPVDLIALFGSKTEADREAFVFNGQIHTPIIAIADVSGGVGGGLLEIKVTVGSVVFKTLKAAY